MIQVGLRARPVPGGSAVCACGNPKVRGRWACNTCDAAYRRAYRKSHPDHPKTGDAAVRARCRSYANVYLRRGKIVRQPCFDCGSEAAKMRHHDYTKPLDITWLCDACVGWETR